MTEYHDWMGRQIDHASEYHRHRNKRRANGHDDRARPSPFKATMFRDIEALPIKEMGLCGIFGHGDILTVFGAPSAGKSVLVGDLAPHMAAGIPWFGRRVKHGCVLYIAAERAAVVKRRFAAWRKKHGIDDLPLAVLEGSCDFVTDQEHVRHAIEHAHTLGAETGLAIVLIVVDTLSRVLNGANENSPEDCPSSEYLRHDRGFSNGGSGSSLVSV